MAKVAKEFGALEVRRLSEPGYHHVGGVAGLILQVSPGGSKSWLLRIKGGVRRREIGRGAYPGVGLADARSKAQQLRDAVISGNDPVEQRAAARQSIIQAQAEERHMRWTFGRCAEAYITARAPGWRSKKHAAQWAATLERYAYPTIGDLLVRDVTLSHVMAIIEPYWTTKTETMSRLRNRIELVLDWARVRKYRSEENPARWKGNLDKLLPNRSVVAPVKNHKALPAGQIYEFTTNVRALDGFVARCLEFLVLTGCRSSEGRMATWSEIDFGSATWNVPGERMKNGRPHRVPLCDHAVQLLKLLPRVEGTDYVFPGSKPNRPMSDGTLGKRMRSLGFDATPHGFRATFTSWCASSTAHAFEVREMALAHSIGDKTVAAYQRDDLFEKRRLLMNDWAKFIHQPPITGSNVTPIRAA